MSPAAPLPSILRAVAAHGWKTFTAPLDLNFIVQRSAERRAGQLDDVAHLIYVLDETWYDVSFACTVDPGRTFLVSPINPKGAAILVVGQYRGMWTPGLHKGRRALVQVGPSTDARDADRDEVLEPGAQETGLFGINFHDDAGAGANASAGCVVALRKHVDLVLDLVSKQQRAGHGDTVTLTVIDLA
jgi:hypothetical protein